MRTDRATFVLRQGAMMSDPIPDLDHFSHADAWRLGNLLVERCTAQEASVCISIWIGTQRAFHVGLPGSTTDNDRWAERKAAIARHFDDASIDVAALAGEDPIGFLAAFALPIADYFPAGGAVPIRVRGTQVGVVAVSGLPSQDDHALALGALITLSTPATLASPSLATGDNS